MASIEQEAEQRRDAEGRSVTERFVEEAAALRSLPTVPFEARKVELVSVTRQAMVGVAKARYSVPSHWKGLRATAYVGVDDVRVECCGEQVTVPRQRPGRRVQVFGDEKLTTALLDRLSHHAHILTTRGTSYRRSHARHMEERG